ncbi:aquaporin-5-like [Mercenaria mercenaria]|uniref:aquaporin-5-like n=1 Tax=Mercenaria mercenaria TaxID=6596 RepID=UPI001E1D8C44|nr:aquaporin-5-like [Mercenaria mercenaria]
MKDNGCQETFLEKETMSIKSKLKSLKEELKTFSFWKTVRCEFLISLIYVFIGCGSWTDMQQTQDSYLKVAFTFGLAQATLMQCVGHISGAQMNPAITISMLATGKMGVARSLCYIIAQCVGAIAGAGILYGSTPGKYHGSLGVVSIQPDVLPGQAFAVEFMVTFVLAFTYFANLEPNRVDMGSRSLSVGLSVVLGHLFALDYTGCGMNPARLFGPAVITNQWKDHWVFWVGPIIGGIFGGFTYEYTQCSSEDIQRFRSSFRRKKIQFVVETDQRCDSPVTTEFSFTPRTSSNEDLKL